MNVFSLIENAVLAWKDRPAVRCGDRRQTYGELAGSASAFAGSLASLGLERGDRVAILMRNGFLYPAARLRTRGGRRAEPPNYFLRRRIFAFAAWRRDDKSFQAVPTDTARPAVFTGPTFLARLKIDRRLPRLPVPHRAAMSRESPCSSVWEFYFGEATTIETQRAAALIHSYAAIAAIIIWITHVYAAIWVRGSMRGMTQGYVTPSWAWRHHRKWLKSLVATGSRGPRPRRAAEGS
jgi:AMP-binding enzyme